MKISNFYRFNKTSDDKTIRWIWKISNTEKVSIVWLLFIQAFLGISSVIVAWTLRDVIDSATSRNHALFYRNIAIFITLILLQIAAKSVKRFLDEYTKSGLENRFKERLFQTILTRDYEKVTTIHSAEWMNRLTSDTVVVAEGLTTILPDLVGMAVRLLGALTAIWLMVPYLGAVLIPGGILLLLVSWVFRKKSKQLHKQVQETDGNLRVFLSERLSSLLIVRSFSKETQTVAASCDAMRAHRDIRMKKNHFSNLCNTGFGLIMNGVYVAAVVFCGFGILQGTITFGSFTAILQLIGQVQSPFASLTGYLPKFYAMLASAERLMEAEDFDGIDQTAIVDTKEIGRIYDEEFQSIELENASFTYLPMDQKEESKTAMPLVFSGVNLEIKKGDCVAVTGHSGCGKSTILKVLMSLYHLDEGQCFLKKTDGTKEKLTEKYIQLFAYVPQGNHLMSGSIREIVAFSDTEKMQNEQLIRESLEITCAADFVDTLPSGIDTKLGERGLGLSEGQMQRIAIARAICSGNPILVLDESTSALDEDTEKRLLNNLKCMTDMTVLIVTHRVAVLQICNRHVVMSEKGIEVSIDGN